MSAIKTSDIIEEGTYESMNDFNKLLQTIVKNQNTVIVQQEQIINNAAAIEHLTLEK